MATVAVTIAGRSYRMACDEGEEGHLQALARYVDKQLAGLKKTFGEVGDQRLVIMTAISVADELSEAKLRIAELEGELLRIGATKSEHEAMQDALASDVATSLDAAAERIERIARSLGEASRERQS